MAKTVTVKVVNNRLLFRCPACRARRNIAILPNLRQKAITCHKCHEITRCILNRRTQPRNLQSGKVVITTTDQKEAEVLLHDISSDGVGFELPFGLRKTLRISLGSHIRFKCSWNQKLFGSNTYEVKSIIGQRVGVKKI